MPATLSTETISEQLLGQFAKLIYEKTGIRISSQKKTLLSNRLRRRMRATGIESFEGYFKHLTSIRCDDAEWDGFLQEITTHETYLFRDATQWNWFSETYLPEVQSAARRGERSKSLKIWSAACSTGDEASTIACCIADRLTGHRDWKIEIVGTDIGIDAVEQAREATFGERAMRLVSDSHRTRFFTATSDNRWQAKPVLTQWMKFHQHNLLDPMTVGPFDVVFVKNVFIYFDADSKSAAFKNIHAALKPRGLLVSGPAEGMTDLLRDYERQHAWLHSKE